MSQIEALIISVAVGLFVGMLIPHMSALQRLLISPKARTDLGVGMGIFLALNLAPLIFGGPWLNRSEEVVSRIEMLIISSVISGFFFFLSFNSERKYRK